MNRRRFLTFLLAAMASTAISWACTSLIAAKGATADGSTMITYAADSHTLYGELYSQPAADHPAGTMRRVVEWDTGKFLGEIPEVPHTYATIGNMNEHGLTISESTWGGRPELEGTEGIIDYGSLIYITLQRARTAREALDVMTGLIRDYGYASTGESFSIADPTEVWIMELIGKGPGQKGAVWVARRVPDGHISGHANHSRIHTFPLDDPETIYSPDVIDFARSKGFFKGKDKDFNFSRAYAVYDMGALRGCDARVWSYFNKMTEGGLPQYLPWAMRGEGETMPLWVKPSRPVTVDDMKWMMRDHFEDTPMDMTKDIGAGPFAVPYRWRPMSYTVNGENYVHERAIATQQTGFSFVSQMRSDRPDGMKGLLWFGVDDANTCSYIPIFCAVTTPPYELAPGNGDMLTLSWDAMFWVTNYVANQAYNRYSQMIPDIRKVQSSLEDAMALAVNAADKAVPSMGREEAARYLQDMADHWAAKVTRDYKALGDRLLVKYLDGNIKKENPDGSFARTPEGMAVSPVFGGYNQEYFDNIVRHTGDHFKERPVPQK